MLSVDLIAFKLDMLLSRLDIKDAVKDDKVNIKIFNDYAKENGLQEIPCSNDTEQIDVEALKEHIITCYSEKYPDLADKLKQMNGYNNLLKDDIKPSEPKFGL